MYFFSDFWKNYLKLSLESLNDFFLYLNENSDDSDTDMESATSESHMEKHSPEFSLSQARNVTSDQITTSVTSKTLTFNDSINKYVYFIIDSGADAHMCNTKHLFTSLTYDNKIIAR